MAEQPKKHPIFIDHVKFDVTEDTLTGAQLRALPTPPVPADRDLFLEVPGGEDRLIADEDTIDIRNGEHFFTVPKTINPGS